jgi:hypothetical protein
MGSGSVGRGWIGLADWPHRRELGMGRVGGEERVGRGSRWTRSGGVDERWISIADPACVLKMVERVSRGGIGVAGPWSESGPT